MMASLDDSFRTILSSFKKRLTQKEQDDFQFATLEDVRREIARIQAEQATRKEMMNMPRIQSFLEAMDQFGKVIEVFLNTSEFVAFIWGPVKFVLQVRHQPEVLHFSYSCLHNITPLRERGHCWKLS
jgi:hypothetical protein